MNRQRKVALAVIGVLVVAGFVIGQLTGNDGAGDRLLASGPTTTTRTPTGRTASTTTPVRAPDAPTAAPAADGGAAGGNTTTIAGAGTGSGSGSGSTTTAAASASAGAPAGGSVTGGVGRTSGVGGGGVTGGLPEDSGSSSGSSRGGGTGSSTTTAPEPDPGPAPEPAPGPDPAPGPQTHILSSADDGKTVAVKVNDLITLTLDPPAGGYWSDPVSDGPAVTLAVSSTREGVVLASFTAVSPGTANLRASSAATCTTANPPCVAPPVKGFKVTITVAA